MVRGEIWNCGFAMSDLLSQAPTSCWIFINDVNFVNLFCPICYAELHWFVGFFINVKLKLQVLSDLLSQALKNASYFLCFNFHQK
jgi:hypothetical protein